MNNNSLLQKTIAISVFSVMPVAWAQMLPVPDKFVPMLGRDASNPVVISELPTRPLSVPANGVNQENKAPIWVMPPQLPPPSSIRVRVSTFVLSGNKSIPARELQNIVLPKLGQSLDFDELVEVTQAIQKYYHSKGYTMAKVYLKANQPVIEGAVQIDISEGYLGKIALKNSSEISDERVLHTMSQSLCGRLNCDGEVIDENKVDQGRLLIQDLPGILATQSFKVNPNGTMDVVLDVKPGKTSAYSFSFDNYGHPATGANRLGVSADLNNVGGEGDQLNMALITTNTAGVTVGGIGYSTPMGYGGVRVGLGFARGQYRLGQEFSSARAHGLSNSFSLFSAAPIFRSVNASSAWRLSMESRQSVANVDAGAVPSSTRSSAGVLRAGVGGEWMDKLGGGGYNLYSLTWSMGNTNTEDARDSSPATGARTAGRFSKISYALARQQAIKGAWTLYTGMVGQFASKNLEDAEKIGLGGPTSVRGYSGEAGGSVGASAIAELRYSTTMRLGNETPLVTYGLFVDRGWVRYYQSPPSDRAASFNSRALSSYGLSFTIQSSPNPSAPLAATYFGRAIVGWHDVSQEVNRSFIDRQSTGKLWLQGGINF